MTEVRIYEPVQGPSHYVMVTPVGVRAGLAVQWWPATEGWRPSIHTLEGGRHFDGFRLRGYRQVMFSGLDPDMLPALHRAGASTRAHAKSRPGEDHEKLG